MGYVVYDEQRIALLKRFPSSKVELVALVAEHYAQHGDQKVQKVRAGRHNGHVPKVIDDLFSSPTEPPRDHKHTKSNGARVSKLHGPPAPRVEKQSLPRIRLERFRDEG